MISGAELAAAGRALLARARQQTIPYRSGGMTPEGMDCQGLCEYLLIQCGLSRREVNLAGSNAHWRESCKWRGTIEEAVALFGDIPEGAWLFIHDAEGGEPDKYRGDGQGNAYHMGQYLGGLVAVHASASRLMVAESAVRRQSVSGGWNRVGLPRWVSFREEGATESPAESPAEAEALPYPAGDAGAPRYVRVMTADGNGVRAREAPNARAVYKYVVPEGTVLQVLAEQGGYYRVHYLGKARYVDRRFTAAHQR